MNPLLPSHVQIWDVIPLLSIFWWIAPYPITFLKWWKAFNFMPGGGFYEFHHSVAVHKTHYEMWTHIPPCSSTSYGTWKLCCSRLPAYHFCPEWCHWVSLSSIRGNLGGLTPMLTQTQSWLIVSWGSQCHGTHQLPSSLENIWHTLLP